MYSMPIVGTSARLYFPDETGREPLVSGCVRNNGSSCAKTSDTTKRYFGTEHGSEVEMTPSALNIKGGSASPISISIDDNKGITITSPKKLTLNADSEIIMKTPKSVKINGVSQVSAQKTGTNSGFSLETDLYFLSDNVVKDGSSSESYPDYDDEPEEGQMPEPPAKKGFNWGGLLVAAVAAVAVVASVVTFGVGAVLIGAAIGAVISIASTAIGDAISGKRSSLGTYIKNAFVGAVSGAIFGPFGAFESLSGMMAFGGLSGMGESLLNQAMEGKFSLGQTLFDGLIGTATAGLLHGAGKLISKVSPYIKNGIGKVLSKLSGEAKGILSKVSGKFDDVLGAFGKTSRELFDNVANKADDVLRNIKNSAQDLADRLSGKFNEITSKIDDKVDDALRSISGKADDALNTVNEWTDRVGYKIRKSLGLQEEYAGIGDVYIPPDKSNFFKDKLNKIISNKNGGSVGNVEFNQHNSNEITEADRIKQFNLNNCRNQMKNDLNKLRQELVDTQDISKICSTVDVGDLNLKGEAGSGIWTYNPTIKDYRGIDPREFCETSEDYTKYYRSLLTDEYLDSLPDNFWKGKNKEFIKEDMSKLRADIERVKREAAESGKFNVYGEPSFESRWNIDNCAEIWSSRDAILKGARYEDLVYRTENIRGGFAEPCRNCQRTFVGRYVISD